MEQAPKTDTSAFWQLSWKIGVIGLVIFIVGCFFTDYQSWGLGVLIGTAFTILRLKLMELSIRHAVQMDEAKKASGYGNFQFMLRQFLAVVVLAAVAIAPGIDPIGAAKKREEVILEEARQEAALIKERTRKDLEREQAKARDELRKETVQMAVMLAQRFVSASIRPQDQNALIEEALAGVEDAEWKV